MHRLSFRIALPAASASLVLALAFGLSLTPSIILALSLAVVVYVIAHQLLARRIAGVRLDLERIREHRF